MEFYKDLIISDKIKLTKTELIEKIENGDILFHTYLIVIPLKKQEDQMEIFHVEISRQVYFSEQEYLVVGVALGKSDAKEMVFDMIVSIYNETQDTDIRRYFIEK